MPSLLLVHAVVEEADGQSRVMQIRSGPDADEITLITGAGETDSETISDGPYEVANLRAGDYDLAALSGYAAPILVFGRINAGSGAIFAYDRMMERVGGMSELPGGLLGHVAVLRGGGVQVIGLWESSDAEQSVHRSADIQRMREEVGLPPVQIGPPHRLHDLRTVEWNHWRSQRVR